MTGRLTALIAALLAIGLIASILAGAWAVGDAGIRADFSARNLAPHPAHPFGTDQMGRDMLARCLHGLAFSLGVGLLASGVAAILASAVALASALGKGADAVAGFVTDAMLSMPHLVLLILISFALGGGAGAVIAAIALSHWPRLARVLRAEMLRVAAMPYVEASRALGRSPGFVMWHHIRPHLLPQLLVGVLLMFPHAILHEAGLTFLGFGLEPSRPAIGIMLAEAMRHITTGQWWLALFPGVMLLMLVLAFETLGSSILRFTQPRTAAC